MAANYGDGRSSDKSGNRRKSRESQDWSSFRVVDVDQSISANSTVPFDIADLMESMPLVQCAIDFCKPDGLRTRALLIENKKIYVCEYYMSVWSPVFRSVFFPGDGSDLFDRKDSKQILAIPNAKHANFLEFMESMYPQGKGITDQNIYRILPLAYEYQCEETLNRCIDFLKRAPLRHMDKIVLADRFHLDNLLSYCSRQIRVGGGQVDFYSNQYERLSDRTKVHILEKMHHIKASEIRQEAFQMDELNAPDQISNRLIKFNQKSELFFSVLRSKSGRHYYCNPYYLSAWSRLLAEEVLKFNRLEFDCATLNDEEIVGFFLSVHPPFTKLNDSNVSHVLKAACTLESPGLIRRCVSFLLSSSSSLEIIDKLILLDECFLHELVDACLQCQIHDLDEALRLSVSPLYDCLSSKCKAAVLDRISNLLRVTKSITDYGDNAKMISVSPHLCCKCHKRSPCLSLKWLCSFCGSYCAEETCS